MPIGPELDRKSVAMVMATVIAAAVGGYVAFLRSGPPEPPGADEGRAIAESFLALIREGKPGEAWDATTVEFKSLQGRETFIRAAAKAPALKKPLVFTSMQRVAIGDQQRSEYLFSGEKSALVRVLLGYERGAWKVDRLTL